MASSGDTPLLSGSRVVRLRIFATNERVEVIRPWGQEKFSDSTFADVVRRGGGRGGAAARGWTRNEAQRAL